VEQQVLIIYAGTNGYLDSIPVSAVGDYEAELYRFVESRHPGVVATLHEKRQMDDQLKGQIDAVLKEFTAEFAAARKAAA
jgi:F-type H+-transporting ATPase subunit alpha